MREILQLLLSLAANWFQSWLEKRRAQKLHDKLCDTPLTKSELEKTLDDGKL